MTQDELPGTDEEYVTLGQAADMLGVTRRRIWLMLKGDELHAFTNPVDRREKLIAYSEVKRLARFAKKAVA
jgi:hypothetical protein